MLADLVAIFSGGLIAIVIIMLVFIISCMFGDGRICFLVAWYDLWIGFFWDSKKRWLYFLPVPCVGLIFKFGDAA